MMARLIAVLLFGMLNCSFACRSITSLACPFATLLNYGNRDQFLLDFFFFGKVAHSAIEMLMVKLEKLQAKMVDRVVEKKHGTRLSSASPVYQKVAAKLQRQGLDCTKGDKIELLIDSPTAPGAIAMVEIKNGSVTTIPLAEMLELTILPSQEEDKVVFAFIQDSTDAGIRCHGLLCTPMIAEQTRSGIVTAMAMLVKEDVTRKENSRAGQSKSTGDNSSKITFGMSFF